MITMIWMRSPAMVITPEENKSVMVCISLMDLVTAVPTGVLS